MYVETRFQFAAQSLETLHSGLDEFEGTVQSRADYKIWRKRILDRIADADDRARVARILRNDKSFRIRLNEIVERVPYLVDALSIEPTRLVDWTVAARNEIVHPNVTARGREGARLHYLCETLRWVLAGHLLRSLEIVDAEVAGILKQHRRAVDVKGWWLREAVDAASPTRES